MTVDTARKSLEADGRKFTQGAGGSFPL